jgi:hypothetical protein
MTEPTIPASIAGVTPAWLTTVLRADGTIGPDTKATILRPVQIGQGVGIMGEIHRVVVSYEGDPGAAPTSVVVKLPSTFEANRQQGVDLGMYEAEVRFYAELGARTGAGLPHIHFASIESGTAEFVIVMEDLSRLEMIDQVTGMSEAQARAAVHVLADIHAAWWDKVQTDELEWIPSMIGPRIEMVSGIMGQLYPLFAQHFNDRLPEGGAELGERFATSYLDLQRTLSARSPWTLAHQDFRVENLLFGDPDLDEVVVIDWQGMGRGPGAYDLAYLLSGSMTIEDRRTHEDRLVAEYHARLASHGIVGYSLDQCRDDYGFAQCLGGLATSIFTGATLDLANERGFELIATMANRHFTAALDHGGLAHMT